MKTITQKQLINSTNIPAALVRAVIKQSGFEYFTENVPGFEYFTENAPDVANHGADGGSNGGFIWHSDTVPFARKNKAAIMEMAREQCAECYGEDTTVYQMIAGFKYIKDAEIGPDTLAEIINRPFKDDEEGLSTTVFNTLAWYALEECSRAYNDLLEQQQQDD